MKGMDFTLPAEIEAHLWNDSDWILRENTIYLGGYSVHDYDTKKTEYYALYVIPTKTTLHFGAHYGSHGSQYISYPLSTNTKPLEFCGAAEVIKVAIIRYFLLKESQEKKL